MASFDLSKANPNVPAHLRGPSPTEGYITGMSTALAVQLTVATAPDSTAEEQERYLRTLSQYQQHLLCREPMHGLDLCKRQRGGLQQCLKAQVAVNSCTGLAHRKQVERCQKPLLRLERAIYEGKGDAAHYTQAFEFCMQSTHKIKSAVDFDAVIR